MKLQSSDSYQPSDKGDHSKRCTRTGDRSRSSTSVFRIVSIHAAAEAMTCVGSFVFSCSTSVRIVCIGRSGSQVSIQSKSGSKDPAFEKLVVIASALRLVLLLCLVNVS